MQRPWSSLRPSRGVEAATLAKASRIELLDSALHSPQACFGDEEFYPDLIDKAAVLAVRIAQNHPLPDGNKRLAWQVLTMFLALNGWTLQVPTDDAVTTLLGVAAGNSTRRGSQSGCGSEPKRSRDDELTDSWLTFG